MSLKPLLLSLVVATAPFAPGSALAAGEVQVSFVAPEKFSDIGTGKTERERVQRNLGDFLKSLAKTLPDGQTAELAITNVDLAGEVRYTSKGNIRVMRGGADWPQVELRYILRAGDQVLKAGDARVSDMAYMAGQRTVDQNTEFGYEKRMLRTWFDQTFGKP